MPQRFTNPVIKYTTDTLKTLPGALLYFYENGTSTPKVVYQDTALTTPHANPVVASSAGSFSPIFLSGTYRVELKSAADVTQSGWPVDNVGGEEIQGQLDDWSAITNYQVGPLVTGSDGNRYESTVTPNLNNDPIDPANRTGFWKRIFIVDEYTATRAYEEDDLTIYNNDLYICIADSTGNLPTNLAYFRAIPNTELSRTMSGGGNLLARYLHDLTDTDTYILPLANSVPSGTILATSKTDTNKAENPIIETSGSDSIIYGGGTDTELTMNAGYAHTLIFKSNGVDEWEI